MDTYATLSASLEKWLNREGFTELTDQTEDLIAIAQRRIHRECDLNAMEEVDSAFTIDSQTEATPTGFLRMKSFFIVQGGVTYEIEGAPASKVMQYTSTCRPDKFAVIGANFFFGPTPDTSYTAQLIYYKALDILSSVNTTNWISQNAPELLLYCALMEASLFLKDDTRAQLWESRYQQTKNSLLTSEERMDKPYGAVRVRMA